MNTTFLPSARGGAPSTSPVRPRRLRRRAAIASLAAIATSALLPLFVWLIAVPGAGIRLVAGSGAAAQHVGPPSIAVAALLAGFTAWGVLAVLERVARHGRRMFAIIGWAVLVLSLAGPVLSGATGSVLVVLLVMHVVTGATLVIGLPSAARAGSIERDGRPRRTTSGSDRRTAVTGVRGDAAGRVR